MAVVRALCAVLVGREAELSELEDALLEAMRGNGGVVVLGGEAGMGKSRLAAEVGRRARSLGCAVMSGACSEADLALPYLPFLEAIGNHLSAVDPAEVGRALGYAAADLAQLFPQLGPAAPLGGDPTQGKLRLFEAISVLLRHVAQDRGLLLTVEDVHWADAASRELLDYLTRRLRGARVLVVATYRTDELHRRHPLLPTVQGWRRAGAVRAIELSPLTQAEIAAMLSAIFDGEEVSEEFAGFLRDRTEGNPFVLEEMLKDAVDRSEIYRTEAGWDRKAIAEMRLPQTVRDTVLLRVGRLGSEVAEVLEAAAVIGQAFDAAMLVEVTGQPEPAVLASLQRCVLEQLLQEADLGLGRYRFRHALTREAIYDEMIVPRRRQVHARVADALLRRPEPRAVDVAHHLMAAGRHEEAAGMCVRAAAEASAAHAFRAAAELYECAIPYVADPAESGRLLCLAGEACWNNDESETARRFLEEGVRRLEAAGQGVEAASQRVLLGRCHWELQRTDAAREEFERARRALEPLGPSAALAVVYIRLAGLAVFALDSAHCLEQAGKAEQIARAAGEGREAAWAVGFKAIAEVALGEISKGFDSFEASYAASEAGGHYFQAQNATYNAAWMAVHLGLGRTGQRWLGRFLEEGQRVFDLGHYANGLVALHRGEIPDALAAARRSVEGGQRSGNRKNLWRAQVLLAHCLAEAGEGAEAARVMPPPDSRVEAQDQLYDGAARIAVQLAAGDWEAATAVAGALDPSACATGSPLDAAAEVLAGPSTARLRELLGAVPAGEEVGGLPRVLAARGRLALAEGDLEGGRQLLAAAQGRFREETFLLGAWRAGLALAEADAEAGDAEGAAARCRQIAAEAAPRSARLTVRLAAAVAARLGFELDLPRAEGEADADAQPPLPPPAAGERMVSVLFADVRGYTALAGRTPAPALADMISTFQRWAVKEVARGHGLLDKFAGDAVMATFNVSGTSVDHALHAYEAALAIMDKASLLGLPVGAGIATGPAVVGALAAGANTSVLGPTTNLAARLQSAAGPGQVLLSEETHRRLAVHLEGRRTAAEGVELDLKGFDRPVPAWRVVGAAGRAG
ncbi:MAG: AAA family ATPase [Candidatus Dormibacterales bacterium]